MLVFEQMPKDRCMSYYDWNWRYNGKLQRIYQNVRLDLFNMIILSPQFVKI
jgi:hypothetical protein